MAFKRTFVILSAASLLLSGFTPTLAPAPEEGGGIGWIGVFIVLVLLIPLVWWLMRSTGVPVTAHGPHHTDAHSPIQSSYPLETAAIDLAPVDAAPVRVEEVGENAQGVVQNVVDEIADTAAEGADDVSAVAPVPEPIEPDRRSQGPANPDDLS